MIGVFARAAFLFVLPAVAVGGALGIPALLCAAGLLSFRPALLVQLIATRPAPLLLLIAFIALAVVSSAWSDFPAGMQAIKIALLTLFGLVFAASAASDQRLTRAGAIAVAAVLAALLSIETVTGLALNRAASPATDINELLRNVSRGSSFLMAVTWAAAATALARPGRLWKAAATAILIASGFISLQFGQFANTVAYGAGLAAFVLGYAAPRTALWGAILATAVWLSAAPWLTPTLTSWLEPSALPYSWNARLEIWDYVIDRIRERPWFGHGLDAARAHLPAIPVHPHSASLQIWFELGVVGAALASATLIAAGRDLSQRLEKNRPAAAATTAVIATAAVIANLSFNLWAEWWFATLFVAAASTGALQNAASTSHAR